MNVETIQLNSRIKVLITDECHDVLINGMHSAEMDVDYLPGISLDEIDNVLSDYNGIIINTRVKMDKKRIDRNKNLFFIGRIGSGLDIIDLPYAEAKGIGIISSPEGNANAVGEHALAMLLSLLNKLPQCREVIKTQKWDRESVRGKELSGSSVGVIGYGHTGSAFVRVMSGFSVNVKVFDKYKKVESTKIGNLSLFEASFDEVVESCDIISLHLPLTDETANLVDESFIKRIKPGSILINTSRGKITDLRAIQYGLENGQLAGCCLDVFPNEHRATFNELEAMIFGYMEHHPNVILSPHVAGWTIESKQKLSQILLEKILIYINKV